MPSLLKSTFGIVFGLLAGVALAASDAKSSATPSQHWSMPILKAPAIDARCGVEYDRARAQLRAMEGSVAPGAAILAAEIQACTTSTRSSRPTKSSRLRV